MARSMGPVQRSYAVTSCLGRGGFGEVYRAEMTNSVGARSPVALKILRTDIAHGGQAAQRLRDEARALAFLDHPAIVKIYDVTSFDGRAALVTELVEGEDLSDCLRSVDRIGIRALVDVVGQVADALDTAYNEPHPGTGAPLRLIHRDVKPSNIRIGRVGDVRLLDFGIARSDAFTREAFTQSDVLVGSPQFMAPERFLHAEPDPASDVLSLGAILLEGLTARRVFDQPFPMLASIAVDPRRYQQHLAERLGLAPPSAVRDLCAAMLAYDPRQRPTAREVADRCETLAEDLDGPDVSAFCRARTWRSPRAINGDLVGKVLRSGPSPNEPTLYVDPTLEMAPAPTLRPSQIPTVPAHTAIARSRRRMSFVVAAFVLAVVALFAATGWSVWMLATLAGGAHEPGPPVPAPEPPVAEVGAPTPAPAPPRPVAAVVAPSLSPRPVVSLPEPVPIVIDLTPVAPESVPPPPAPVPTEPEPVPAASPGPRAKLLVTTAIEVDGVPGRARLHGNGTDAELPAAVAPGLYVLSVTWPDGSREEQRVQVPVAASHVISCGTRMRTCR